MEARKKWISGEYNKGDGEDPAIQICFREEPFENPEFKELSREVYSHFINASTAANKEDQ